MSYEADLQNFPKMRRERGAHLVAADAVRIDGREGSHLLATVRDRKLHTVHLTRDAKGKLESTCSCMGPAFCEHAAAVILTDYLRSTPRAPKSVPATRGRPQGAPRPAPPPPPPPPPPGSGGSVSGSCTPSGFPAEASLSGSMVSRQPTRNSQETSVTTVRFMGAFRGRRWSQPTTGRFRDTT